jgi:hypothetical protein
VSQIIVTKSQVEYILDNINQKKQIEKLQEKWNNMSKEEKVVLIEMLKAFYPEKGKLLKENKWYNTLGDIVGIFDPTGIVDFANGISYFTQGDYIFGTLSMISAVPYIGDVVAKPVTGALKIGGAASKSLRVAEKLAKAGKTVEASAELAKLAKEPGVIGSFLRKAENWAPKLKNSVGRLPGGVVKGFRNTILDWLTLLERSGAKSSKFASEVGKLAKNTKISPTKQLKNIDSLKDILKNEKIWKSSGMFKSGAEGLTKRGTLSQIFLGGAPRLFGDRRMRILMRQTKWWLGFLDWVGLGNFVGPEEIAEKLGGEQEMIRKMEEYNKTDEAKKYANEDFPDITQSEVQSDIISPKVASTQPKTSNSIQSLVGSLFTSNLGKAALTMV